MLAYVPIYYCSPYLLTYYYLIFCDPSCCPPATCSYYNSQASTYKADYTMSGQADDSTNNTSEASQGITSTTNLARQRARENEHLTGQSESLTGYQTSSIQSTIEQGSSPDSSEITYYPRKRPCYSYARGMAFTTYGIVSPLSRAISMHIGIDIHLEAGLVDI